MSVFFSLLAAFFLALNLSSDAICNNFKTLDIQSSLSLIPSNNQSIAVCIDYNGTVQITLSAKAAQGWFAVGFNGSDMKDTYAIVVHGTNEVNEYKLANYGPGDKLTSMIDIISDSISNGIRTVILIRQRIGINSNYYTFPFWRTDVPIITAYGQCSIFNISCVMVSPLVTSMPFVSALECSSFYSANESIIEASVNLFPNHGQSMTVCVRTDDNGSAIVSLIGNNSGWFGMGFGDSSMNNTYAIIVSEQQNVSEYLLGNNNPGHIMHPQMISVISDSVYDDMRTVVIERARIGLASDHYFTFPNSPTNVDIIYAYGQCAHFTWDCMMVEYNAYHALFSKNDVQVCGNSNSDSYGMSSNVGNGLDIGFYINCTAKTMQITVTFTEYDPKWFGIVFNDKMESSQAVVFTTGKASSNQRNISLYAYNLLAMNINDVNYVPDDDWRQVSQVICGTTVNIIYEQDLVNTKWSINTETVIFRYAHGSSGTSVLSQHASSATSEIIEYNLLTGALTISYGSVSGWRIMHASLMCFCWYVLASIGILSSRFRHILYRNCSTKGLWFWNHRRFQMATVVGILIGLTCIVYITQHEGRPHFDCKHGVMGLIVICLAFLQPINAYFRPHAPPCANHRRSMKRLLWQIWHKGMGYGCWITAQYVMHIGIDELENASSSTKNALKCIHFIIEGVLVLVVAYLWLADIFRLNEIRKSEILLSSCVQDEDGAELDCVFMDLDTNLISRGSMSTSDGDSSG